MPPPSLLAAVHLVAAPALAKQNLRTNRVSGKLRKKIQRQ